MHVNETYNRVVGVPLIYMDVCMCVYTCVCGCPDKPPTQASLEKLGKVGLCLRLSPD